MEMIELSCADYTTLKFNQLPAHQAFQYSNSRHKHRDLILTLRQFQHLNGILCSHPSPLPKWERGFVAFEKGLLEWILDLQVFTNDQPILHIL